MGCINKNLKDNQRLIQDFSETRVNQLFDEYFQDENPSYSEFISNPNVKEALGIIPISKVKSEIGKAFGKEISSRELKILKKSISDVNDKLLGYSYKLFNIKQKGESDNYSWGLRKINSNINIQAKIDRLKQRINTGKQIRNLEDNQFNFPDINSNLNQGLQWLKQIMPDVEPKLVDGLIDNIANGSYNILEDLITLSKDFANKNVIKEEAFHRVFNLLPKSEQEKLLNEGSKKYGIERGESKATIKYSLADQNKINFGLKSVEILQSDKAKQIFDKGEKNKWDLNKILNELQIPKEQKQLILDLGKTDREEIITDLLANYSYTVDINTAKENLKIPKVDYPNVNSIFINGKEYKKIGKNKYTLDGNTINYESLPVSVKEYLDNIEVEELVEPILTQHYSNLTVPGGTNYTENEIATPAITPSIKGHAQFSTDNGIGWFRSDDKSAISRAEENERILNSTVNETANVIRQIQKDKKGSKTRRILEVQSDLFQKGRDNKELVKRKADYNLLTEEEEVERDELIRKYNQPESDEDVATFSQERLNELNEKLTSNKEQIYGSENQFLQLLNKDNNWVTFFVKSIIQDSAKKGYEKVLFPSGKTVEKIEGFNKITEELERINNNIEKHKKLINDKQGENIGNDVAKLDELEKEKQHFLSAQKDTLSTINFYENTVTNILNKTYGKENVKQITDEYGNTWNEITLTPKMSETIRLNTPNGKIEYTGDLAIEEKIAEEAYNSKDEKVAKTLIGKFIQSIRNLFRNLFKEKDRISRLIRDLNQGRFNLQNDQKGQGVRYSTNQNIKPGVEELFNSNPELSSIGTKEQYSQYLESLNKPNTNPILQGNQQEQAKKFAELQERLNNKEFLEGAKNAFESSEELQNVYYEAAGFETELPSYDNIIETDNKKDKKEKLEQRRELVLREINTIEQLIKTNPDEITIYQAGLYEYDPQITEYFDKDNWEKSDYKYKTYKVIKKPSYLHTHLEEKLQHRIKNLQVINSSLFADVEKVNYSNIFKEGRSYSSVEVLKYISDNEKDVLSGIAKTLIKYAEKNNVEIQIVKEAPKKPAGAYFYSNKIEIYGNKNVTSHTLIHEIIHSFSSDYIRNNSKSLPVLQLENILKNILDKKILKEYSNFEGSYEDYATKNIHELLSEIISRPDILAHLALYDTNYNLITGAYKKETLLDKIIKTLSDIFNFSKNEIETLSDLILFNARDIFEASPLWSEFSRNQITPQQKQDALNAYTDYLARVSLGIIKNPSSGEYNYDSKAFAGDFLTKKPDVILPIGTSGSGKSTFIKSLPQENLVVIEPDSMRVEFTGNMNDKSKDKEIYIEAANRAVQAIKQGKQVVFDTTNLTKDKRLPFIESIKKAIPTANIQYKLMELNPELAKQRIKAQLARGENRAAVSDETINRHAESYKQMLEDIKSEPITKYKELGSKQDVEGFKEFVSKNNTKPKVVDIEDIISYEGVKGDYKSEINRRALNEPTDSDVFHYPFSEVYDELDQSEPTGEFEDTFDSEFETNSKKLDKIILNRYLKIQKSLERQKDKLVSEFNKIENTNDFTKDAEIYFDKHKELISEINIVEEKLKRIKAVVDAIFDKKDITSVVIAESNLIIDDINKLLKSENISPAELDYYYNLTKLLEEIHDENLKQEDSSLFTNASSEDLNQLKKLKNTFSNLNNDLLELLRKNINIKNDPIKDAKLFSQWFLKIGDYTNDILKKAESMISKSLFNITKFLNKELEAIKELHLKADSDFKRTGKQNNKFDIFFDKNKRIVQVFNYEYTDAAAKLYNAFRFASKDSAKSKRLELIRFHKQHSILLNAKYLFPDIYEHLTGTKVSAEEINKNIALYKSYLDDYTFEKMKSKVYKQTIKYLSKRDNDFFMSNMPFDENSLIQEFLTYIPKDKSNYNDKYSKIVQNDNLRNVYDKFMDLFNELKLISQGTTRSNLNKGFLPFLEKTMIENLSDFSFSTELGKFKQSILSSYDQLKNNSGQTVSNQVENPLKTVNDGLRSFLETKANDYYKQEKINLIYFLAHKKLTTNSAKLITEKFGPGFPSKKAEEIIESWTKEYFTSLEDTQTNDIQVLMNLMAQTVTSYKQKQAIESNLNLIKIAFDNQAVGEFDILGNLVGTNPTKKGRETKLAELLEVTINHFFGKNIQKPQLNDFLKRINNVSVAKQEELNKLVKEINENKELTPNEKIELEKALQNKFKKDSKYVDLDKINDKLLQYLRVLFLGWSPKSAFFNAAMGHIGNYMETIDGRIVDSKDLSAGVKMLFGKEKKKIQKLIANLSLIEDITKDFKKTTEESLHNEKWKNFKPERLQQIVEKSNQSPLIAALLNKSFNGVRIIDMIDESGNFLPQYEEYEYKFVNTAKYLIEKVHGPYDSNRIIMAETTSLGKNVIFMKKWMITSFFMKRFGSFDEKPREDLLMDYQFKGTYITLADVFNTMSNDQSGQRNYLLGIMKTMKAIALSDQSLTEVDKANLRSVRADLLIIGALLIAQQLVKYMLSDDDDDHEGLVFLLNTFFRIETELGSHYFLIDTFEGLAKNTIPQLDVYNRLEKIIKSFDENARISPAIRLAQMVPALNSGVSLYNFFNQQILYNR